MRKAFRQLGIIYLATFGVTLSYLIRIGLVNSSLGDIDPGKIILLLIFVFFTIYLNVVIPSFRNVPFLKIIVLMIFIVTTCAYFYTQFFEVYVPYSIEKRVIIQALSFFSMLAAAGLISRLIRECPERVYYALLTGLCLVISGVVIQILYQGFFGAISNRFYGISGEPKGLALYLVPFIVAFCLVPIWKIYFRGVSIVILVCVLSLTFSSTGFLSLVISLIVSSFVLQGVQRRRSLVFALIGVVTIFFLATVVENLSSRVVGRIGDRVHGVEKEGITQMVKLPIVGPITVDGNDAPALRWILANPIITISGNGYGLETVFSYPYLIRYGAGFLNNDYDGYLTPNLAIINNILNYGLVVLLIMTISVIKAINRYRSVPHLNKTDFIFIFFLSLYFSSLLVYCTAIKIIFSYVILMTMSYRKERYLVHCH